VRSSNSQLIVDIVCRGHVTSQTTSRTDLVRIEGEGSHDFELTKPVIFDGARFLTRSPHGWIRARQIPQWVAGKLDTDPLIGPLANQMAWSEVHRRRPEVDQAIAQDLAVDVGEQINSRVDAQLRSLTERWRSFQDKLATVHPNPTARWTASHETDTVRLALLNDPDANPAEARDPATVGSIFPSLLFGDDDLVVYVSENMLNDMIASVVPTELVISDTQLQQIASATPATTSNSPPGLQDLLQTLTQWNMDPAKQTDSAKQTMSLYAIEFSPSNRPRVTVGQKSLQIQTTFRVLPRFGAPTEWMTVAVPIRGRALDDQEWTIETGVVRVTMNPDRPEPGTEIDHDSTARGRNSGGLVIAPVPRAAGDALKIPGDDSEREETVLPDPDGTHATSKPAAVMSPWPSLVEKAVTTLLQQSPPVRLPRVLKNDDTSLHSASKPGLAEGEKRVSLPAVQLCGLRGIENGICFRFRRLPSDTK
ncbi:MAG: hypothetical protein KDA96_17700, partial [Planctomycetaceae bacterium]|nr:hypothetical protein [Planctomycetaceae bacterium]